MPVQVQGPDGATYQFPDGTDKAAAIAYFKKKGIGAKASPTQQPESRTVGNYLSEATRGVGRGLANDAKGIVQTVAHPLKTAKGISDQSRTAYQEGLKEFEQTKGAPLYQRGVAAALTGLENAPVIGGMVQHAEEGGTKIASPESVGAGMEAATTFAGPDLVTRGIPKAAALSKEGIQSLRRSVRPTVVPIEGEGVPALKSEAHPDTKSGRLVEKVKRSGIGEPQFRSLEGRQQEAVKNVVRQIAKSSSGLIGPISEEPGAAMGDSATATFNKARPMYEEIDKSLETVPDSLDKVSKITQDAITKARKLGVNFGDEGTDIGGIRPDKEGTIQWGGSRLSKTMHPERWKQLVDEGIIDDSGRGTPLTAYMKVRSQLLKMQRSASDPAVRYAIGNDVKAMNDAMDEAFTGTPLDGLRKQADRLWSQGYAIRDVADAIRESTEGTPASKQASSLTKIPTKLQGGGLVKRLNSLSEDGTLDRAFNPEQAKNLRAAADILDRAGSQGRGQLPIHSYSVHSAIMHALLKLPYGAMVKTMTTPEGVAALREAQTNPAAGMAKFSALAGVNSRKRVAAALSGPDVPVIQIGATASQ